MRAGTGYGAYAMINIKEVKVFRAAGQWKDKLVEKFRALRRGGEGQARDAEMTELSAKLRLHWSRQRRRAVLALGGLVLLAGAAFIYGRVRVFHHYRILSSVERSDDSATTYVRFGSRILKCNPNGVTCVNNSNEVQWNVTFTMQSPMVDTCGSVVAVGDQRGQSVYLFDKNGQIGHFETEYMLSKVRVASQGVVAAVLSDGEITWINLYDSDGNILVRTQTSMSDSGYPLDVDLSQDGQKMAVSYLTMDNRNVKTRVLFYNFSSVGQNEPGYVVNSAEYEGTVVPQVSFLKDNYAVVFRDNGLTFFGGRQVPEQRAEITLDQEIISVFYSDSYVGLVTASDEAEQKHKYKMQIYRANGSRCGTKYFDLEYQDITLSGGEILMHGDHGIEIYSVDGNKEASVEYEKQILDVIRVGGLRRYEIITPDSTDRIRLK